MADTPLATDALVLYKHGPARIRQVADKLEIDLPGGRTQRVRPKDVRLLHPGPLRSFDDLASPSGDVAEACELLQGESTTFEDLAALIYGAFTPATAWATWGLIEEGVYFLRAAEDILARDPAEAEALRRERAAKLAEQAAWDEFIDELKHGRLSARHRGYLDDVELQALGRRQSSRVLQALNREQSPENAHALLLRLGVWESGVNVHPRRLGLDLEATRVALGELPDETRVDLTHLDALAIDDEGNEDPDDALSLDGSRLWVHVADAGALVRPDSPADLEARGRAATLYLPEAIAPMLPDGAMAALGLGLQEVCPALSFGLDLHDDGETVALEVVPSWVRVRRLSYREVEERLDQEPFRGLYRLARRREAKRRERGAIFIDLPEVSLQVRDGQVRISPQPPLASRRLVSEAMLMAGEAAARYALEHEIPFPFATQEIAEVDESARAARGMAAMVALRRGMRPRRLKSAPEPHQGLGLEAYSQVTSPLRRYLDLVAHQQLRAHLRGEPVLDAGQLLERIGAAEAVAPAVRKAERLSRTHWTLVYLSHHPDWSGEGVLVERRERRGKLLIPALGLETSVGLRKDLDLDSVVPLRLAGLDLPTLEARFRVAG